MLLQQFLLQGATEIAVIAATVIIGLLVVWIIVSIPVWIVAKILTLGRVKFTRAMLVTAFGPIVYALVFFIFAALLNAIVGDPTVPVLIAFIVAFVAWIGVFKKGFHTGWLRALGIAYPSHPSVCSNWIYNQSPNTGHSSRRSTNNSDSAAAGLDANAVVELPFGPLD